MENLSIVESDNLLLYESIIERGLKTFVEVGNALLAIRESKLYRQDYGTFEEYCQERWGMQRAHAYRLIDAAGVVKSLSPIGDILPATESQARPLTQLEPEEQAAAWQQAVETAPNGKVTAAHVQQVVDEYKTSTHDEYYESLAESLAEDEEGYDWQEDEDDALPVQPAQTSPAATTSPSSMDVHYSSKDHTWETPQSLFDLLDGEFGFTLDVCAAAGTAKCERYFSPADDGLIQDWSQDICWMNPPYGDQIEIWMRKANEQVELGATVVCLVPARVDTGWWWDSCICGEIRFLKGRVKFRTPGKEDQSAPFPSAVVVLGKGIEAKTVWWDWKQDV